MEQRNSGAGRKEELTSGAARSMAERASAVRASSADRWARGRLLASARGERGLARAALVGAGRWQAKRGLASWAGRVEAVGPRKRKEVGWAGLRVWVLFPFLFFSNTLKLN